MTRKGTATKKPKAARKPKATSPEKPKAARKKKVETRAPVKDRENSFAGFLDRHMLVGATWAKLQELAMAEADRRGIAGHRTVGALKAHARFRGRQDQWTVKMDSNKVKLERL